MDIWSLSLDSTPHWSVSAPSGVVPPLRRGPAAIYDPVRKTMLVWGGTGCRGSLKDLWVVTWGKYGHDALPAVSASASASDGPNPARVSARLSFVAPFDVTDGSSDISVFDIAGRRVRTLGTGALRAGVHVVDWDLRDANHARVKDGVYFVKIVLAGTRVTRRIVVVG